jgi:hypothetical protein
MILLKLLLFMVLLLPLMVIQALIFIFGGWTLASYERPNIIFDFMDWLDL